MTTKANNNRADRGKNRRAGNAPTATVEEHLIAVAKELRIKPKTKALYDEVINNKGITQREAYIQLHPKSSIEAADSNASKLLRSDKYNIYKASAVGKAKKRIVSLVSSGNESIALKASQDILDRTEGKATQKTENITQTVEVKLDLTGVKLGNHFIEQ